MTALTPRTPRHQSRTFGLLASTMLAALIVAGCSSPAPEATIAASATPTATSTPTPTPTAETGAVEEPQSEEEAIAGATAAATAYYAIRTAIEVEHPADSSAIDSVAVDAAAAKVHDSARKLVDSGMTYSGAFTYDVTDAYANASTGADGTVHPFGAAQLTGCVDSSSITATNSDGSPVEMNPNRRGVLNLSVLYYPAEKAWLVQDVVAPAEVTPC